MKTRMIVAAGLARAVRRTDQAQVPDGFGGYYGPVEQGRRDYYEKRAYEQQFSDDLMDRDPWVEYQQRDAEDRIHVREACAAITNNPAARMYCSGNASSALWPAPRFIV